MNVWYKLKENSLSLIFPKFTEAYAFYIRSRIILTKRTNDANNQRTL